MKLVSDRMPKVLFPHALDIWGRGEKGTIWYELAETGIFIPDSFYFVLS